jgi:molecular chaperone GrpE
MTVKQAETEPGTNADDGEAGKPDLDVSVGEEPVTGNGEPGDGESAKGSAQGAGKSSADAAGGANSDDDPEEALAEALERIREMEEGHLRAQAEVENIRRRSQKEIVSARKYAIEAFARELLSVKDSLDQAAQVELGDNESEAVVKMQEGLELTARQLGAVLARFDVVEVEAGPGVRFDPDRHQAISMLDSGEVPSDHIIDVMQKGFLLKDRLLRPAMVVVAR